MIFKAAQRLSASAAALAVGLALVGVAGAQEVAPQANAGIIAGMVARCVNGVETPAAGVSVGVEGGSARLATSGSNGGFFMALPGGQYTIVATADDGTSAARAYVPVQVGETLDIGVLDIGGGLAGCAPDADASQPLLPTFTPTQMATPSPPPAETAVPAPTSTATPSPAVVAPTDVPPPGDMPAMNDTSVPSGDMPAPEGGPPAGG